MDKKMENRRTMFADDVRQRRVVDGNFKVCLLGNGERPVRAHHQSRVNLGRGLDVWRQEKTRSLLRTTLVDKTLD